MPEPPRSCSSTLRPESPAPSKTFIEASWAPIAALSGIVYSTVRGVTKAVGFSLDRVLSQLEPLLGESAPGPARLAMISALNGVLGDVLQERGNPLAMKMELFRNGEPLDLSTVSNERVLVMVHGSSMNDLQWNRHGHDHGVELERALGFTTVCVRYNSGLHISTNGKLLAAQLETLAGAREISIVAHSMGGLVARSACFEAETLKLSWRTKLKTLVCLATPHQGAPLERGGNWLEAVLGITKPSAPLAKLARIRSAGVTDLRWGNVRDSDWKGRDRFSLERQHSEPLPLPEAVRCFAVAASQSKPGAQRLRGDGLVPVESALGHFPKANQLIVYQSAHLDVLDNRAVFDALRRWLL